MEKSLPSDLNAEKAAVGAIFLDRDAIIAVAPWLSTDHFYLERHAWIYEAQLACYNRRIPPDLVNVADELRRLERLESIGGPAFLVELANSVPTATHIEYYARIVERTALLRRLIQAGGKIAALGYDESEDIEAVLDKAETELLSIAQKRATDGFVHISTIVDSFFEQITRIREHNSEVAGLPTGFRDLDELTGGLQRSDLLILAARPAVGKCLKIGTIIDDPETGERLPIEEFVRRKVPGVYGICETGRIRKTAVSDWIDNGLKPCFQLRTRTGRTIDVTDNHPFLTVDGWTPLRELSIGKSIAIPRAVPIFGKNETWPIELVRLLAYFIAEGALTANCPMFTNTDPVIITDFKTIIETYFPECQIRHYPDTYRYDISQPQSSHPGQGYRMPPNPVVQWLNELGLMGKLSKHKSFPSCVWTWSKRYLAEFLRVLMSCDGSIYRHESGAPRIEFGVASEQLAADLYHAFIRFGILAKFYHKSENCWRVQITEPESVLRYQQEIGWIGEKATRFADFEWKVTERGSNFGHPPQETWQILRQAIQEQDLSFIELARQAGETTVTGKYGGYNPHTNRTIPQYRLSRYAEVLDEPQLRMISSPDLYWDEIVSISPIGDHRVYDLTVPEGSNFIAQDILVHNSSFALSIAYNVALHSRASVGFFALEMSREQLVQRILATHTGVDTQKIRTGNIRESDLQILMDAMGMLSSLPIYIDDTPAASIMDVRSKCRRLQAEHGLDLVVIDYLQLMSGRRSDNRVQEVSEISRGLKALAREVNVPVIALSQLSRAVEGRTSHVPMLSDLRESGSIEQDADIVMFIYREELYDPETDKKGIAEIHLAKHRNGPVGIVPLRFFNNTTKFADLERYRQPEGY